VSDAPDLSPREARDHWLDKLRVERSKASVSSYHYRLKLFVEWAEAEGIETMRDLSGWDIDQYEAHRRGLGLTRNSLYNELTTLEQWLDYCERVGIVDADLSDAVDVPELSADERSRDKMLEAGDAAALLSHYRTSPECGTRGHVLLELAWYTAARAGGLAALDLRDVRVADDGTRYLAFVNRPETGTRLKKGTDGERPVLMPDAVWAVIDEYIDHHRLDVYDDQGRQPLLASQQGRPTTGTLRDWMYMATVPCLHSACPHERERETCEYLRAHHAASGCPSSRAPHHVRTGAITWMRDRGVPAEIVADRVNASVETIETYYDKADPVEEMLQRRGPYLDALSIDSPLDHDE
jgi:site-specific recombinase XerD